MEPIRDGKAVVVFLHFGGASGAVAYRLLCGICDAKVDGAEPLWTFDRKLANQHLSAKQL